MWGHFDTNKEIIKNEYKTDKKNIKCGKTSDVLIRECNILIKSLKNESKPIQKARLFEHILKNAEIEICPFDFFGDKINHLNIILKQRNKWCAEIERTKINNLIKKNAAAYETLAYTGEVDFSHTAPDWQNVLDLGIPGILKKVKKHTQNPNLTKRQCDFYKSCEIVYSAVIEYMKRMSALAKDNSTDNPRFKLLSQTLDNLCISAPKTLYEAMELTFILYYIQTYVECVNVRTLGAIDRLWYKFYKRDLESGRYTQNQQRELIRYFLYRMGAIDAIANTPICLCSTDTDGKTVINELTYVIIEEYGKLKIADPKLHIRYNQVFPEKLLKMLFELIRNGTNSIVFMNDDIVIKALEKIGVDKKDAIDYVPVGCYEPTVFRREVPCSCSGRINLLKAVELAMTDGYDMLSGKPICSEPIKKASPATFEQFKERVASEIKLFIENTAEMINGYEKYYIDINPAPLFSGTFDECVLSGKDAYEGGAKYNNTSIDLLGLASAVDSMLAIKYAVYDKKLVSLDELTKILKENWKDNERLRLILNQLCEKYGNNTAEANALAKWMSEYAASLINGKKNGRGGIYRCGMFSIDWYADFGGGTGASADGRFAKEPLSKNICAVIGKDKKGVTEVINTVTGIDYTKFPNGAVFDALLHPSAISGDDGLDAAIGLFETFIKKGGMSFQLNVLNPETLKKAQKNPEMFETLQVRLCGWNVYFVNLSMREQNEFIKMAENTAE